MENIDTILNPSTEYSAWLIQMCNPNTQGELLNRARECLSFTPISTTLARCIELPIDIGTISRPDKVNASWFIERTSSLITNSINLPYHMGKPVLVTDTTLPSASIFGEKLTFGLKLRAYTNPFNGQLLNKKLIFKARVPIGPEQFPTLDLPADSLIQLHNLIIVDIDTSFLPSEPKRSVSSRCQRRVSINQNFPWEDSQITGTPFFQGPANMIMLDFQVHEDGLVKAELEWGPHANLEKVKSVLACRFLKGQEP